MKSTKLTNAARENILRAVIRKVITPKTEALDAKMEEALATYLSSLVPEGFPTDSDFAHRPRSVDINIYDQSVSYTRLGYLRIDNVKGFPVKCKDREYDRYNFDIEIDVATEWGKSFNSLFAERQALADEEGELRSELSRLLYGCATTKQLLETYPAIEQYVVIDTEKALPVPQDFTKLTNLLRG